jgi:tetratricopeptide (TPR) repeat protein
MSRELSGNERRLAALAALAVFWGALLVAVGIAPLVAAGVVVLVVVVAAVALVGKRAVASAGPWARRRGAGAAARGRSVDEWLTARSRAAGLGAVGIVRSGAGRVERVDWSGLRDGGRARVAAAVGAGRRGAVAARERAAAGTRRAAAAGGAAVTSLEAKAREARAARTDDRSEALKLNERAASLRHEGHVDEALELGGRALELFRSLGDRRGEALTLNGLGLTQVRSGDEAGAVDAYEKAAAILTELGDSHGAGRVLANLGALHRSQGHDEQAQAYLHDALERLEPGSPEHDRTAQQLRLAG